MGRGRVIRAENPPFVPFSRRPACSARPEFSGNKKNHMPDARGACRVYDWGFRVLFSKPFIQLRVQGRNPARFKGGYGVPRGFKGEKSKSPPNPLGLAERRSLLPPPAGGPPPSKREVWGEGNRAFVECRRARDARPYNVAVNCNCEMRLQRWVASLQRLDAFTTVGCTAVLCRGAHCAPVYLRCYNNLSSERAKGHRGDRKAPISNRRQGRRP